MITKCCPICGKEFKTNNYRAKYCSDECKKEGRRLTAARWHEEHPEYLEKWKGEHPDYRDEWERSHPHYGRDRSRKKRGTVEYKRVCAICGKTFTTVLPQQITCSPECSRKHHNRKHRASPEKEHDKYIKRVYGSESKRIEHLKEKAIQQEKARADRRAREKAEKEARAIHRECVVCGKEFATYNPKQRTCCPACSKKLQYARKQHRIPKSQIIDRDITLEALYKRDSGVCYLCGGKCDWNDKTGVIVGGKYPSIDHVVPIAAGGLHSWDNVRLAHFRCNVDKSDKILPHINILDHDAAYKYKRELRLKEKRTKQLDKDGVLVAVYKSTVEAARATGLKSKSIQNCARGQAKTCGGYQWVYV